MALTRETSFRRALGRAIRAAREERGLTQRALAEEAAIAEKYLSRIEVGASMPSVFVAAQIADVLGIGLNELLASKPRKEDGRLRGAVALLRRLRGHDLDRAIEVLQALTRVRA